MNEDVLAALFDNAAVLIVILDREGRIVRFNRTCEIVSGYSEAEVLGEHIWKRLLTADEAAAVAGVFHRLVETTRDSAYTNYWVVKNGDLRQITWRNSAVLEHGCVKYVIAVGADVTVAERERLINQKKNAALESSLNAVALAELDGIISYVNPSFLALWGYQDKRDVLGRSAVEFWSEPAAAQQVMAALLAAGRWVGKLEGQRRDGSKFIAELSAAVVRDEQGAPLCIMASFIDVTPLQTARDEAQRNQRRFEALFNGAREGIVLADVDTMRFVSANPRWCEMVGYGADEIARIGVPDVHPADSLELVFKRFGELARGETEVAANIPVLRKDGSQFWADIATAVIEFEGKNYLAGLFRDVTERLRAERELRASEEKYRLLVENQNELVVKLTPDLRLDFVNPAYCRTFGKKETDLLNKPFLPLVHPDDRERVLASLARLHHPPHTCYHEERAETVDGWRWLAWSDRAMVNEMGDVMNIIAVGRDITERKEVESRLRHKEQQLEEAQHLSHLGSWTLDTECRMLQGTSEFYNILNVHPGTDGLPYRSFLAVVHPDDRGLVDDTVRLALGSGDAYKIEFRIPRTDDEFSYVQQRGHLAVDPETGVNRLAGTLQDVTPQRKYEDQLRQWAAVFGSSIEGVVITDADANIIDVNPAFVAISGYTRDEVIGKKPSIRRSHLQSRDFFSDMWHSINTTGTWRGEVWNRKKNGEVAPEWLTITTLYDGTGAVTNYVGVFTDISALKASEQRLEYLATHDPLTGLPNRVLLSDRIGQAMARQDRNKSRLAVLFLDLDRFKNVNDTLGHPVGDRLLIKVAERLVEVLRRSDTVGRLGGDEFLVLLDGFDSEREIELVADKIIGALTERFVVDDHELYIGASIGISIAPDDGFTPSVLIQNSDAAMYKAKEAGRNNYQYYSQELTEVARQAMEIELQLRSALEHREFSIYFQPKIDLSSGAVVGAEALLRWNSAKFGAIPPDTFIPVAEDNGLIVPIGRWVIEEVCRCMAKWRSEGFSIASVAVNVSGVQIHRGDLVATVDDALSAAGLPSERLQIEVTESVLMQSPREARRILHALRERGIGLALDDFGTGFSSLSNLKDYPFTTIKVDKSFVTDIFNDSTDEAIVKAVIAMGQSLQLEIVAEGVETREHEAFLARRGCTTAQGYLYSPPLPREEFEALMLRYGCISDTAAG